MSFSASFPRLQPRVPVRGARDLEIAHIGWDRVPKCSDVCGPRACCKIGQKLVQKMLALMRESLARPPLQLITFCALSQLLLVAPYRAILRDYRCDTHLKIYISIHLLRYLLSGVC